MPQTPFGNKASSSYRVHQWSVFFIILHVVEGLEPSERVFGESRILKNNFRMRFLPLSIHRGNGSEVIALNYNLDKAVKRLGRDPGAKEFRKSLESFEGF